MIRLPRGWSRIAPFALAIGLAASSASAATFTVDSTGDEPDAALADGLCRTTLGTCTLRAAIEQANALAGSDTIAFNIPGIGVHTISPVLDLPALTDDAGVTIDGYTQPGSSPNTLLVGSNAVHLIELQGTGTYGAQTGFLLIGSGATIRGLVINRFRGVGIAVTGGFGHRVIGCYIGTGPGGAASVPNGFGVSLSFSSSAPTTTSLPTTIIFGGSDPAERNVISGNSNDGIYGLGAVSCVFLNNYIGVDASGAIALPNGNNGFDCLSCSLTIGRDNPFLPGAQTVNVISGNAGAGIALAYGIRTVIVGNFVGTGANGSSPIPNGSGIALVLETAALVEDNVVSGNSGAGIYLGGTTVSSLAFNHVGSDLNSAALGNMVGIWVAEHSVRDVLVRNEIAFNSGPGFIVGLNPQDLSSEITVSANAIHENGGLGIDLGDDGVTPNNDCDSGRGPNLLQNYPVLTSAVSSATSTIIRGTLNSVANSTFSIEFFSNTLGDPSGYGEGQQYIGSAPVTTDNSCHASFEITLPISVAAGSSITATAADQAGNTSEFSACRPVTTGQNFYTIAPCRVADTRNPTGPYGGPPLTPASDRSFVIAGQCGIPPDAWAVAFNFAVTQPSAPGDLQVFPGGTPLPAPATLYYAAGQTRAKNAIYALGPAGEIGTRVDHTAGTVQLVIDVAGYFR